MEESWTSQNYLESRSRGKVDSRQLTVFSPLSPGMATSTPLLPPHEIVKIEDGFLPGSVPSVPLALKQVDTNPQLLPEDKARKSIIPDEVFEGGGRGGGGKEEEEAEEEDECTSSALVTVPSLDMSESISKVRIYSPFIFLFPSLFDSLFVISIQMRHNNLQKGKHMASLLNNKVKCPMFKHQRHTLPAVEEVHGADDVVFAVIHKCMNVRDRHVVLIFINCTCLGSP